MQNLTRRKFVALAGMGALCALAGNTLPGCSSPAGSSSASSAAAVDKGQVVVTMTPTSEPAAGFDPLFSWGCGPG